MPRARLLPAALLCALPLIGCDDDGTDVTPVDPEEAQLAEEAEDLAEAKEDLRDAEDELEEARGNRAEQREEHREAVTEVEEAEDAVDDSRRGVAKAQADLQAEKTDPEPDYEAELAPPAEEDGVVEDDEIID